MSKNTERFSGKINTKMIERLRSERAKRNLSMRAVAEEIGISVSTMSRLERSKTNADEFTVKNILEWLKVGKNQARPLRRVTVKKQVEALKTRVTDTERRLDKLETDDKVK